MSANKRIQWLHSRISDGSYPNASRIAEKFGVYSIPTLVVMKDGKVHRKVSGARPKAKILELLD